MKQTSYLAWNKGRSALLAAGCLLVCLPYSGMVVQAAYGYAQTESTQSASYEAASADTSQSSADTLSVDPDSYILPESAAAYLSSRDISALSPQELCYARNEIYARHGLLFASAELQQYFDRKNWYWGTVSYDQFSDSVFNEAETANVSLLLNREKELGGYVLDQDGYSYAGIGTYSAGSDDSSDTAENDYIFPDSDSRYLTDADISPLSLQMICYAKNEIFARRGYIFTSRELKDYFGAKSWYVPSVPSSSFSFSVFNEYESANVDLLSSYEYYLNPNGYTLY